jgi:hypothetical protein
VRWSDGRLERDPSSDRSLERCERRSRPIGTLHNLEREGPLAITEAAGVVMGVAAPDAPAPPSA